VKLYTYPPAPNPRRLDLLIAVKGLDIPVQIIDLRRNEAKSPAYLALNPRGLVPALELDDGSLLCDALAIALYLEDRFPQPPLFGASALERARIVSRDQQIFNDGFVPVAEILRNENPAFADRALPGRLPVAQIPALIERGRSRLQAFFEVMEAAVNGRDYLEGDALSWADICLLVVLDFAGWTKTSIPESCGELRRWHAAMRASLAPLERR
jgi:glutathione S-transferase